MPVEIIVPRQGWTMEEAIFAAWLKSDGELIQAGDALFSIESDKATQEIESFDAGFLHLPQLAPKPGEKVRVGQLLGYLLAEGEPAPAADSAPSTTPPAPPAKEPAPTPPALTLPVVPAKAEITTSTPRARRVARELDMDWTGLPGTGRDGRIREADIRKAATARTPAMTRQQRTAPVTLHTTADATALVRLRDDLSKADTRAGAIIPGCDDLLVKLVAAALRAHPVLNARWDGDPLRPSADIHIGVAVDAGTRLLFPVLRHAALLPLLEIASRSHDFAERARRGQLAAAELQDATFSITNLAAFGIDAFAPAINAPECAILGIGRITRQPVEVGETVVFRSVITLSLSFDPRAFDTAPAARFLQTLTRLIESPLSSLLF